MSQDTVFVDGMGSFPKEPHYAIIEFSNIHIPGDKRSRTNPRHGYPAHAETQISYVAYLDKAAWEAEILKREQRVFKNAYVAAVVHPASVETSILTKVKINIKEK